MLSLQNTEGNPVEQADTLEMVPSSPIPASRNTGCSSPVYGLMKDDMGSVRSLYFEAFEEESSTESSDSEVKRRQSEFWIVRFRQQCGDVVNNGVAQLFILGLIIVNALLMGIETFDFVTDDVATEKVFKQVDRMFLCIFTVELVMQFIYRGFALFHDGWLVFDFLIIVFSWSFDALQVIRSFRIFRALRLITRIKVLQNLVIAIGAVMPRMTAIGFLLMLIFYIFSVLFTELFKDLTLSDNYFGTLDASLFTCFQMMTMEWSDVAREVMAQLSWAWIPFMAFIAISGFIVFNLIIAVVCDAVAIADRKSREEDEDREDTPEEKLFYAENRIDILSNRVTAMLQTQQSMQVVLEMLAEQIHTLES